MPELNAIGHHLQAGLAGAIYAKEVADKATAHTEKVNIVGAGGALTAAYEQLRNAAENTEEHLLLQNAIRRFYKQLFVTRDERLVAESGNELAVELTLAGYLLNNTLVREQLDEISALAVRHYKGYEVLQKRRGVNPDTSTSWLLDTLSVGVARILAPNEQDAVFVDVAYLYFEKTVAQDDKALATTDADELGVALYAAVHKALLKSDVATIRAGLLQRYQITIDESERYIAYNQHIDRLLAAPTADKVYRIVDRRGAPMRIIRRMIEDRPDFLQLLPKRDVFLDAFEQQVDKEYRHIASRVNRAIVRSVIFLIITKFLVGIAVEVPYDIWAHGQIVWLPLVINLLFPPIYMILLRLTLTMPGYANTVALTDRVDVILYGDRVSLTKSRSNARSYGPIFSGLYIISGLAVFAGVMWLLLMLGFSLVHIGIFLAFLSAASFLGFRLSRMVRELEVVRSASNGLTFIRDFIYLPFVVVGRWMSEKYAKVNIVALVLDMLIELPLKTVLRLVRQWGAFIDDRKDKI